MKTNNSNTIGTDFKAFKLSGHFSVHAQVMKREWRGENKTDRYCAYFLKSYDTIVARITFKNCKFGSASVYGLYSTSTRKHINWFFTHFDSYIPLDVIKVAAGNEESNIVNTDGAILEVITDDDEVLYSEVWTKKAKNQAVKKAVENMKTNWKWNNFDWSDYIGREY